MYPEDEHQLIAAYAHQLANSPEMYNNVAAENRGNSGKSQMDMHSRQLVRELERKNREIMRDIHQLKHAHRNRSQRLMQMPTNAGNGGPSQDPTIVTELEVSAWMASTSFTKGLSSVRTKSSRTDTKDFHGQIIRARVKRRF